MDPRLSVTEMLARLDEQIAHSGEREAYHAGREAFHREQRSAYAADLDRLTRSRDSLKVAAEGAAELVARDLPKAPAVPQPLAMPDMGKRFRLALLVEKILERKAPHERFGAKTFAAEVNQAFGDRLTRRFNERQVAVALASLAKRGKIARFERGKPFHESQYVRSG
jgi:hypothetical protein